MRYIIYRATDGSIMQHREHQNIQDAHDMLSHIFGLEIPSNIQAMQTEIIDFPFGKKVDLDTLSLIDA